MHGGEAARNSGRDVATGLGNKNDQFVEATKYGDANGRGAVGKGMVGISLRLRQQIFHAAKFTVPNSQLKPGWADDQR